MMTYYLDPPMGIYEELYRNSKYTQFDFFSFIGYATSVPDGSSPRGYSKVLVLGCRLTFLLSCRYIVNFPLFPFYRVRDQCFRWE
jgi:hypothetical protein